MRALSIYESNSQKKRKRGVNIGIINPNLHNIETSASQTVADNVVQVKQE